MSEENRLLSSKCTCGKGSVIWRLSDQCDTSDPMLDRLDCLFCSKDNHIESFRSCLRSHNVTTYYLVPNSIVHMDQPRQPIPKNFIEHMVYHYSLNDLNRIEEELSHCKTIADMTKERLLAVISEQHNKYEGVRRVSTVKKNVQAAIDTYPNYEYSYDSFMESIRVYSEYQKRIINECTTIEYPKDEN